MTTIVAVKKDGVISIAADSQSTFRRDTGLLEISL
jgi:ATP-dependent protease HslVU (ClpYQ) peptidase subunit